MKTTISTEGQIILPAEFRQRDAISVGVRLLGVRPELQVGFGEIDDLLDHAGARALPGFARFVEQELKPHGGIRILRA